MYCDVFFPVVSTFKAVFRSNVIAFHICCMTHALISVIVPPIVLFTAFLLLFGLFFLLRLFHTVFHRYVHFIFSLRITGEFTLHGHRMRPIQIS